MKRSVYTQISKELGHSAQGVKLPSLSDAQVLLARVEKADRDAFKEVFKIWRFAPGPDYLNADAVESSNCIADAFKIGSGIFQNTFTEED